MLYDVRTYTCRPGTLKRHLALYAEHGFDIQRRHLGEPLAYLQTETGNVNSYTHIWVFADAADRAGRRAAMQRDPAWASYLEKSAQAAYLVSQETKLMVPVPFFEP
ncbi:NIPSNAP family protein [Variovorax sp. WS11]|uniref:NIPSNAP family protein n=1 Tax=Variovorax sp. WS11 TaxID=1105204 RepID=UPI000D0C999E|nr:NIPSNAP family protein [Variovorax sp. WS11]NDZ18294.1 NIPSNAP family protein [Variovorax sp. WS11]PSL84294.1 NIPSNAP family protein [Variovorax sp. WS11]